MDLYNLVTNIESCVIEVPALLYYSHIPTAAVILLLSVFVLIKAAERRLAGVFLFLIAITFAAWSIFDIILWTTLSGAVQMFFWSLFPLLYMLLFIFSFLFLISMTSGSTRLLSAVATSLSALTIPAILLTSTTVNLPEYNASYCEPVEGALHFYQYGFGLFVVLTMIIYTIYALLANKKPKSEVLLISFGILSFLFAFSWAEIVGSLTLDWELTQYGLFGMPVLAGILAYAVVQYKIFNVKLVGAQALVIVLWALIGSLLFVAQSTTTKTVAGATLIFTTFAGYLLVRSVKKEVQQREELEVLTTKLEKVNLRLQELDKQKSEFVSIASHQLRSPLTAIRGYASMLAEGSFGKMPEKAQESAKRIEESAKLMAYSIEDYLNVSRIESGNMKYNLSDFNLRDMVDSICDDLRPEALKKSLILLFRSNISSRGLVNADVGKVNQIVHNLINNSLKYTPKGSISVFVRDDVKKKRIYVDITDTGIGMSKETAAKLFHKFSRADNANSVNVSGTGLGLFVALKMAEAMGGDITAQSEGDGKGSTFTFELPLAM